MDHLIFLKRLSSWRLKRVWREMFFSLLCPSFPSQKDWLSLFPVLFVLDHVIIDLAKLGWRLPTFNFTSSCFTFCSTFEKDPCGENSVRRVSRQTLGPKENIVNFEIDPRKCMPYLRYGTRSILRGGCHLKSSAFMSNSIFSKLLRSSFFPHTALANWSFGLGHWNDF